MAFPIASLYAALGGLLVLALAIRVIQRRRGAKIGLGDGADADLQRRIRVHANAIEYLPLTLLLLLLLEGGGASPWLLHGLGASMLLGRLLHAWGLSQRSGVSFGRFWGTLLGLIALLAASLALLLQALGWS